MSIHDDYETAMQVDDVPTKESGMTDRQARSLYEVFWYKYSSRTRHVTGSVDVLMLGHKPPCCECSDSAPRDVPRTETVYCSPCGRHYWTECSKRACTRRRLVVDLRNKGKHEFLACRECRQRFECDELASSWNQITLQLLCSITVTLAHTDPRPLPPPTDDTRAATGLRGRSRGGTERGGDGRRQATAENAQDGGTCCRWRGR